MFSRSLRFLILICLSLPLVGCGSIAKGVTEAILDKQSEDLRECKVIGPKFSGVKPSLDSQTGDEDSKVTKVLVVHGISKHLPGYSTHFKEKLVHELGLTVASDGHKEIKIKHQEVKDDNGRPADLGVLRLTKHTDVESKKTLLFYELTWSEISDPEKEAIAFDTSGEYSFRRAELNQLTKTFFNETVPDLMVYRGSSKRKINLSVAQAVCWTFASDWQSMPHGGRHYCDPNEHDFSNNIMKDDFFFVTHSLGSQITIDTLTYAADISEQLGAESKEAKAFFDAMRHKEISVFMLSNQLPLLQLGLEKPKNTEQKHLFCEDDSKRADSKIFEKVNLIAFSDPNDILSYPIPPNYADQHLDSKMCASIVNVDINVTEVQSALGVGFANPLEAHGNYWKDDRVVKLISEGIDRERSKSDARGGCKWVETIYR